MVSQRASSKQTDQRGKRSNEWIKELEKSGKLKYHRLIYLSTKEYAVNHAELANCGRSDQCTAACLERSFYGVRGMFKICTLEHPKSRNGCIHIIHCRHGIGETRNDLDKPVISHSVKNFRPLRPSDLHFNRTTLGSSHKSTAYQPFAAVWRFLYVVCLSGVVAFSVPTRGSKQLNQKYVPGTGTYRRTVAIPVATIPHINGFDFRKRLGSNSLPTISNYHISRKLLMVVH